MRRRTLLPASACAGERQILQRSRKRIEEVADVAVLKMQLATSPRDAVIAAINTIMNEVVASSTGLAGLPPAMRDAYLYLDRAGAGTVGEVACALRVSSRAAWGTLNRLVRYGLAMRTRVLGQYAVRHRLERYVQPNEASEVMGHIAALYEESGAVCAVDLARRTGATATTCARWLSRHFRRGHIQRLTHGWYILPAEIRQREPTPIALLLDTTNEDPAMLTAARTLCARVGEITAKDLAREVGCTQQKANNWLIRRHHRRKLHRRSLGRYDFNVCTTGGDCAV